LNRKVIAFIPVRGGSKGIPGKNIKKIAGKPLVCYAIDAALMAKKINHVVVSTDSEEIKQVVQNYYPKQNNLYIFDREPATATDTATTESAMLDFTNRTSLDFEDIILIQATSPLIESQHIDEGYHKYCNESLKGLVSVCRQKRFLWSESDPQNYDPQNRARRQEFNGHLVENGAFYITSRESLLQTRCRVAKPYGTYEMPESTYFEIDEPEDWIILESLLKRNNQQNKYRRLPDKISAVVLDFDGVFTDNKVIVFQNGEEAVVCDRGDGMGISQLKKAGIDIWVLSKEQNPVLKSRCEKLKIPCIHGVDDKWPLLQKQLEERELSPDEVIYVGNDVNDIECMQNVGCGVAVNDSHNRVIERADLRLDKKGGNGAIRELADRILEYINNQYETL